MVQRNYMKDAFDYAINFPGFQTKIKNSELIYFDKEEEVIISD